MNVLDYPPSPNACGRSARLITPSDTNDIDGGPVKCIIVAKSGTLAFLPAEGDTPVVFTDDLVAGYWPPYHVRRVLATGTTATVYTVEG